MKMCVYLQTKVKCRNMKHATNRYWQNFRLLRLRMTKEKNRKQWFQLDNQENKQYNKEKGTKLQKPQVSLSLALMHSKTALTK